MNSKIEKRGRFIIQEIEEDSNSTFEDEETNSLGRFFSNNVQRSHSTNFHITKIFHNEMEDVSKEKESMRCEVYDQFRERFVNFNKIWEEFTIDNELIKSDWEKDKEIFKYEFISKNEDEEAKENKCEKDSVLESTFHDSSSELSNENLIDQNLFNPKINELYNSKLNLNILI